jgi:histidinol-phosphate/aromatic aminotransferase/cobyric acid decarboxylase-like protein
MPPAPEDARLDVPGGALDWPDPLKLRLCAVAAELRFGAPGGESRVELESALASRSATDAFGVLLGASAAELMAAVLRATVSPGQIVAAPASSGGALAAAIAQAGARVREIPSAADPPFAIDVERAMAEAHGAQVVVLASPDPWTGAIVHPGLVRLLEINGEALLLLDETEQPWSGQDWSAFVGSGRVAIVRALGPALGHAALPLAYLLAPPALVAEVRKLVDASAINSLAVAAARIALEEPGLADARAHAVRDEKARLALALEAIGRTVVRGSGSFVLIASDEPAREYRDLRRAGVCVGEPSGPPGYLRVYAGTAEDGDRLVAALARQS